MSKDPTGRGPGRPLHIKTALSCWTVETLTMRGIPQGVIAKVVGISERSLRGRYRHEIDTGQARVSLSATQKLMALIESGDNAAIQFWLRTRAGFRDGGGEGQIERGGLH